MLKKFFVLLSSFFLFQSLAIAQPAGARGNDFIYLMQAGDTIATLAERFTDKPSHWRKIKAYNHISNSHVIPVGKAIRIPFALIDTYPDHASIINISGSVLINNQAITSDTLIKEGDTLITHEESYLTFRLSNDNIIAIAPNSIVHVQRLRRFAGTGLIDTIFSAEQGEFSAKVESNNGGVGRFEIHTPVSITGVRGTSLRSRVSPDGDTLVELLKGSASVSRASRSSEIALPPKQGAVISKKGKIRALALPEAPDYQTSLTENALNLHINKQGNLHYLVRFTKDEQGLIELNRYHINEASVTLPFPTSSVFYTQIRAIEQNGLAGLDATKRIAVPMPSERDSAVGGSSAPNTALQ